MTPALVLECSGHHVPEEVRRAWVGGAALAFVWGLVLSAPGGAHYTMAAKAAPWVPIPTPTNLRLWPPGPLGRQFSLIVQPVVRRLSPGVEGTRAVQTCSLWGPPHCLSSTQLPCLAGGPVLHRGNSIWCRLPSRRCPQYTSPPFTLTSAVWKPHLLPNLLPSVGAGMPRAPTRPQCADRQGCSPHRPGWPRLWGSALCFLSCLLC